MDNEPGPLVETARSGDPVAIARLLVSTPSVNPSLAPGGDGESQIASIASDLLTDWGLIAEKIEVSPGRFNVVARLEGEGPTLLLNGHLDTVGIEGMTVAPFAAEVVDGRLIGRGACDMKGGVAALLSVSARLARDGPRPNLVVALTADEEHASVGMADFVDNAPAADLAVVCEPTSLKVMPAHKGFVWLRAAFRGRAAHGSRPDLGVDAIRHAGLYLAELEGYSEELKARTPHPLLDHGSFHAGKIEGGTAESVYPDLCVLLLERRTMPGESAESVLQEFQRALERVRDRERALDATLDVTLARHGTEVSAQSLLVQGLLRASEDHGIPSAVAGMTAWVDAAFLNQAGIPAVCYGPGGIEQAHTQDEWIEVGQIGMCADVLESFARELAR